MSKKKKQINKTRTKTLNTAPKKVEKDVKKVKNISSNSFIMKLLVFLGVLLSLGASIYLMDYFFIEHNDIKINMSTDKKAELIPINGKDELILSQKYISDLGYSMRYDVDNFSVFKYKNQDIYKYNAEEKILIVVENGKVPEDCTSSNIENSYNDCSVKVDDYTDEYYKTINNQTFKITVKTPNIDNSDGLLSRIEYMLDSFEIN